MRSKLAGRTMRLIELADARLCLFILAMVVLILGVRGAVLTAAGPTGLIVSWKNSKTGDADRMFLVKPGETITFSVVTSGVDEYQWQVNKKVQDGVTGDSFTWTVPDEKGIWEIHLKVSGSGAEAHTEWVVSTLSTDEAPDIFDYFADKKAQGRTETDPWGRALPEWSGDLPDLTTCSIRTDPHVDMTIPSTITEGTWIFWYRFTYPSSAGHGGNTHISFYPVHKRDVTAYTWEKVWDAHHHCCVAHYQIIDMPFSMDYDGTGVYEDGEWHKVILIRKDGYFYAFKEMKHSALPDGKMIMFEFHAYDPLVEISDIKVYMRNYGSDNRVYLDSVQVYENKYLFPVKGIHTGDYYYASTSENGRTGPLWKEGIIVQGRGVRLQDIADAINDPSIFTYDEKTKTAVCYKDLVVDEGAELIIKDETLKFHCTYDGELAFVLDYGSRLHVENSTITSDTPHYWVWNLASSTTHWGNEKCMYWPMKNEPSYGPSGWSGYVPLDVAYHGEFTIKNATVNNFAHLFLDSPYEVHIIDSRFTNIHEVDIANYPSGLGGQANRPFQFCKGDKSVWIYTDSVNINDFTVKNTVFSGAEHPLNFVFSLNAHRDKYNIYNVDARDDHIVIKESMAEVGNQSHSAYVSGSAGPWGKMYTDDSYIASELGLVNCRFKDIIITPGIFKDADDRPKQKAAFVKYYLDVKVVDNNGPVPSATVKVEVEQDWTQDDMKTNHYPVENTVVEKPYATGNYRCFYHHYRWVDGQEISSVLTTSNGRTPLPSEDPAQTLVITDYKKYRDLVTGEVKQTNFTYTITASKGGKTATLTGLDIDATWYRKDPNSPEKTVVLNLDTGTGTIITKDKTPPEITLKTLTINGGVDDDTVTEVEINGVPVPVTAGKYSYEVDVSSTKTITITATNDKGETVTRTIEVK